MFALELQLSLPLSFLCVSAILYLFMNACNFCGRVINDFSSVPRGSIYLNNISGEWG